jgi:hypothetical protein
MNLSSRIGQIWVLAVISVTMIAYQNCTQQASIEKSQISPKPGIDSTSAIVCARAPSPVQPVYSANAAGMVQELTIDKVLATLACDSLVENLRRRN